MSNGRGFPYTPDGEKLARKGVTPVMTLRQLVWDEWRGSMDGRPTLWVKHLLCGHGYHIDLHKMVARDDAECFHTHPAFAIRVILWHMGGSARGEDRGVYFACACGFSVLQTPVHGVLPETLIKAVNEHLRMIVIEEGSRASHLKVVASVANGAR